MTGQANGFEHIIGPGGEVTITHHGRKATTLRGPMAQKFLVDLLTTEPQELMARLTGNYRRGNERTAKNHPRNSDNRR